MTLGAVSVPVDEDAIPDDVGRFLRDATRRIETFVDERLDHPIPAFVPSDFEAAWRTLRSIARYRLAPGTRLCEWGCGFGVVATLAARLGFEAYGIEIEPDLVAAARSLADSIDARVAFEQGTFVPRGGEHLTDDATDMSWLAQGGPDGHDALDLDPSELDVVYAFPWAGEEAIVERLFDRFAATGALLVTYRGMEGMIVLRRL